MSSGRDAVSKEYPTDEIVVVLYEGERAALCRCGGSQNKPFCDGTHRTNGFCG